MSKYEIVRQHWDEILKTVRHIITQFADEAVEIASRLVMLLAPMPNAISLYNITQVQQGFSPFQALAFALTIEMESFFLIEVALLMLSGWLKGQHIYRYAFWAMCMVVLLGTGIVINLVYALEPHKVMAWLPVLSLCGFIAIGLKRWDSKNYTRPVKMIQKRTGAKADSVNQKVNQHESNTESTESIILNYYLNHPLASQREAAESTGLNQSRISRLLNQLESAGKIHRNGNGVEIMKG